MKRRSKTLSIRISYRVTEEQWRRLEEEAEMDEVSVHDWCRAVTLEKLQNLQKATEQSSRPPSEIGTHPPAETGNGITRSVTELCDGHRHPTLQWGISRERGEHNLLKSEEQNRNLLRSLLPICDFSAHFKFPTAVTHVGDQRN